jgi:hypothetical protein
MEKAFILTFFLVIVTVAGFSLDWIDCLPKEIPYSSVVNLQSEDKELEDCLLLKTNFKEIAFKMYKNYVTI